LRNIRIIIDDQNARLGRSRAMLHVFPGTARPLRHSQ
jgi:hypothetical protein